MLKIKKVIPTKLILISATVLGIGAGATAYMVQEPQDVQEEPTKKSIQFEVQTPDVGEKATDTTDVADTVVDAPAAPTTDETATNPSSDAEAQQSAPAQPQAYKFAAEMTAAGIATADQGYVTDMLLDDSGWRLIQRDKPLWHLARQMQGDLTQKLQDAKLYIDVNYGGSWAVAHEKYVATGIF